jgi:tyrosyl-tRNA synthetase
MVIMKNELEQKIDEILTRGVGEFIDPDNVFRKKLIAKAEGKYDKDIIVKYGVDPTRPDIHLGHAVCFRKLRQLQDLGCKVVFLVGDYTAKIGDPTGKNTTRPEMDQESVENNMKTYLEQIDRIIKVDPDVFSWIRNSDWFLGVTDLDVSPNEIVNIAGTDGRSISVPGNSFVGKAEIYQRERMQITHLKKQGVFGTTLLTILRILRHITFAQLKERDMFKKRIENGNDLYMHEMLYPIFQGIDSLSINKIYGSCDLEVGGTDQTFNMLMGRDVQKNDKQELINLGKNTDQQAVLSFNLLEGTDGKEKMSKSLDNYIGITEESNQMFGKVMSIPDSSIINYFELCTEISAQEIEKIEKEIQNGKMNPRDAKLKLAFEITKIYHGENEAQKAQEYFINTFSKKEIPQEVAEFIVEGESIKITELLVKSGNATSLGDARRKIEQGGVSIKEEKITDPQTTITKDFDGNVVKVGKFGFVKVKF